MLFYTYGEGRPPSLWQMSEFPYNVLEFEAGYSTVSPRALSPAAKQVDIHTHAPLAASTAVSSIHRLLSAIRTVEVEQPSGTPQQWQVVATQNTYIVDLIHRRRPSSPIYHSDSGSSGHGPCGLPMPNWDSRELSALRRCLLTFCSLPVSQGSRQLRVGPAKRPPRSRPGLTHKVNTRVVTTDHDSGSGTRDSVVHNRRRVATRKRRPDDPHLGVPLSNSNNFEPGQPASHAYAVRAWLVRAHADHSPTVPQSHSPQPRLPMPSPSLRIRTWPRQPTGRGCTGRAARRFGFVTIAMAMARGERRSECRTTNDER